MKHAKKSIMIDPDLWFKARIKALTEGMTMQDLIIKLLIDYIKEEKG